MGRKVTVGLTEKRIDAATYPEGWDGNAEFCLWDSEVSGFGLRVYPSGRKGFIIRYRKDGRRRTVTLGAYGTITLKQARDKAKVMLGGVGLYDTDPAEEKKRNAIGQAFVDFWREFEKRHLPTLKPSTQNEYKRLAKGHLLSRWRNVSLKALRREEVSRVHHKIGAEAPYQANRLLALISVLYTKADEWGAIPQGWPNPAKGIKRLKEVSRERWVKPAELPRLAEAIDAEPDVYVRAALWLYLLTGARRSELLEAKWSDVDLELRELLIPDPKQGKPHHIPLSAPAVAVLENLPREGENPYVFPGRKAPRTGDKKRHTHLVNIAKPWDRIRSRAGIEDVRLHDLRRTVGSWLATSGVSLPIIGRTLGHSQPTTTAVYARLGLDPVRDALDAHGQKLMDVAGGLRLVKNADDKAPTKRRTKKIVGQ